jgi:hypothetical protein
MLVGSFSYPCLRYPAMLSDTKLRALKPKDKPYRVDNEQALYVRARCLLLLHSWCAPAISVIVWQLLGKLTHLLIQAR